MAAKIIDGKQIASDIRAELKAQVEKLKAKGVIPGLGVILVGADPASISYVTAKEKACTEIGIYSDDNRLPAETSEKDLLALVNKMNKDPKINGKHRYFINDISNHLRIADHQGLKPGMILNQDISYGFTAQS